MVAWIKGKIATRQLKKWAAIQPKPDVLDVMKSLMDAGFTQEAALSIINAIVNLQS